MEFLVVGGQIIFIFIPRGGYFGCFLVNTQEMCVFLMLVVYF